jgi:hypothetical protein
MRAMLGGESLMQSSARHVGRAREEQSAGEIQKACGALPYKSCAVGIRSLTSCMIIGRLGYRSPPPRAYPFGASCITAKVWPSGSLKNAIQRS